MHKLLLHIAFIVKIEQIVKK